MDYTVVPGRAPWIVFITTCNCMATHVKQLHVLVVTDMWTCHIYRLSVQWCGKTTIPCLTDFLILIHRMHFFIRVKGSTRKYLRSHVSGYKWFWVTFDNSTDWTNYDPVKDAGLSMTTETADHISLSCHSVESQLSILQCKCWILTP
jgi:hypothetical protein